MLLLSYVSRIYSDIVILAISVAFRQARALHLLAGLWCCWYCRLRKLRQWTGGSKFDNTYQPIQKRQHLKIGRNRYKHGFQGVFALYGVARNSPVINYRPLRKVYGFCRLNMV